MFEVVIVCVTLGKNGLLGPVMHTRRIRLGFIGSYLFETDDDMLCVIKK